MVYQRQKKEKKTRLVIRGPPSLGERVKLIHADETQLSQNQLLLNLLDTGMLARDWGALNWKRIEEGLGDGKPVVFDDVLPQLLDAGLEVLLWLKTHREELPEKTSVPDLLRLAAQSLRKP